MIAFLPGTEQGKSSPCALKKKANQSGREKLFLDPSESRGCPLKLGDKETESELSCGIQAETELQAGWWEQLCIPTQGTLVSFQVFLPLPHLGILTGENCFPYFQQGNRD